MYANPYEHRQSKITDRAITAVGFTEHQHKIGSMHINYLVGPNNGPALVLIPAQMGMWESYHKVMPALARRFQVYVVEVRGHGKSSWTPGDYSWKSIGEDMRSFLKNVVKRPAIVSGNSSGGIIALWCGANAPELVAGVVMEDAPVFSVEMPRFKERDRFVYNGLVHTVQELGDIQNRDLANYFKDQEVPVSTTRAKRMPNWFVSFLSKKIKKAQAAHPDQPLELKAWYLPRTLTILFKSLSMFDPDFARSFIDGRMYEGLNHTDALKRLKCPLLVLHANWRRYQKYGLVGAMDDDDATLIKQLVPHAQYKKIPANHVIHMYKPKKFIAAIEEFAQGAVRPTRASHQL